MSGRLLLELTDLAGDHLPGLEWLSSFHLAPLTVDVGFGERTYASAEHAYQAAKATDQADHDAVAEATTPDEAKERGRAVPRRPDWRAVRADVMREVLAAKFAPGSDLAERLLVTGNAVIVEVAPHGDAWNGVAPQDDGTWRGRSVLGVLLMERRGQLRLLRDRFPAEA